MQEGWDCSFAYILTVLTNPSSATGITQLVGRILRQPFARKTKIRELDECYVYTFRQNASTLVREIKSGLEDEYLKKLRVKGYLKNNQMRMRKRDGSELWILENATLIKEAGTGKEFIEGALIDITETKRIQQALQESEQNYKGLIEHTPDGIFIHSFFAIILKLIKPFSFF